MRKTCDSSNADATASLSSRALSRSWPNGFSMTTRVHGPPSAPAPAGATRPRRAQAVDDGAELGRRHGQVEEAVAARAALGVERLEVRAQRLVGARARSNAPRT